MNALNRRDWLQQIAASGVVASGITWHEVHANLQGKETVSWLDCSFSPRDGEDINMLLMLSGNRVERAVVLPYGTAAIDVTGLRHKNDQVTGEIVIGHEVTRQNRSVVPLALRMPLKLNLKLDGSHVKGTFAGLWPKSDKKKTERVKVQGAIVGVRRDEQRLQSENELPTEAVWTSYVGPNQNFSSAACSRPLIENLGKARLLWASQYIGPCESGSHRYGACVGTPAAAGGASPLVWAGRVYQFRYQPAGDTYQKHLDTQLVGPRGKEWQRRMAAVGWTLADMRRRWAIDADEQLVCIDAATGKTLWTTTWKGEGLQLFDHKCSLTNHTGVAADGKIFVFGALGKVRCVDGDSGKVDWQTDVPGYSGTMRKLKAKALADRHLHAPTRSFCHGLNVSGGTVVAPDGISRCGLVGLDAATGKVRWRVEKVLGKAATPLAWSKNGTDYVIAANEDGLITCIEATTGKIVWRYTEAGDNEYSVIRSGDYLLGHKLKKEAREKVSDVPDPGGIHSAPGRNYGQVACWKLTSTGLKQAWLAPTEWGAPANSAVGAATDGLVCFRGKFSYYLVEVDTGKRLASHHLPEKVRWDEGHLLALPGMFVLHPDTQHGHIKMFSLAADAKTKVQPMWMPPHPHATTYQAAMSHAWADGRLFIRGLDAIYCYDLRVPR